LSIGIIKIVSQIYGSVCSIFIFPVFIFLLLFAWWAYVIGVAVVLYGAGTPVYQLDEDSKFYKVEYTYDRTIQYLSIYHFIGFL
jgi:hypothetical protein